MNTAQLISLAQEKTGLTKFDSDSFLEPLEQLLNGIAARPEHEQIFAALKDELVASLSNRLRVTDYLNRHPELADAPIEDPVIIMGMPRTGTTALSYLLDCDPQWRSLLNWEAVDSVPPPTTATLRTDPRCVAKKKFQEEIFPLIPFAVPHWEWADGPTECIFVHAQDFKALSWEARAVSREYADYLLNCDMTSAYDYQKKVMRVLQSQAPGRWLLKMPSHALHFQWALKAFPNARFIWAHRNPFKALASLGTTISAGHMSTLGAADKQFIHDVYPQQIAEHVNRPMALRKDLAKDKIFDVYCNEFLSDPIAGIHQIYRWLGLELSAQTEQAMRDWLKKDNDRQAERPKYALEDFGWTHEEIAPYFAEYLAQYPKAEQA